MHRSATQQAPLEAQQAAVLQQAGTDATDAGTGPSSSPQRYSGLRPVRLMVHLGQAGAMGPPAGVARDRRRQVEPQPVRPEVDLLAHRAQGTTLPESLAGSRERSETNLLGSVDP